MFFDYLVEDTLKLFASVPCTPIELPKEFAKAVSAEHEGELMLENRFFKVAGLGELRIAHTCAPKISIIAVFFFPEANYQLPTYSMEFVLLGQKPVVALMDMLCLVQPMVSSGQVEAIMAAAHKDYPALVSQVSEMPAWFEECRSCREFFYKPGSKDEFVWLSRIHVQLMEKLVGLFAGAGLFSEHDAVQHRLHLNQYKEHHAANSPGIRLMNRSFGEMWTHRYLSDYLFS